MTVHRTLTPTGAAQLLELKRSECDLAVQLGHIRATTGTDGGPPRIAQDEIDRLRAAPGFPETLRERVRTVGTKEGAELLLISPSRFTRLARTGHFVPVGFCTNRYHAVVWLYLAEELRDFAQDHPDLLTGRATAARRPMPDDGEDRRPRTWRGRRVGLLLREAGDPWRRAAVIASVLDPVTVAEVVTDPYERAYLRFLRPEFASARPQSTAVRELAERLRSADHPDEILWHRSSLAQLVKRAREIRPVPRPNQPDTGCEGAPGAGVIAPDGVSGRVPDGPGRARAGAGSCTRAGAGSASGAVAVRERRTLVRGGRSAAPSRRPRAGGLLERLRRRLHGRHRVR